jgi:hypothetical protein
MEDLLFLALLIVAVLLAGGIAIALIAGMAYAWQLSLVLILLGGFMFGGTGALIGGLVSGAIGLAVALLLEG